MQFYSIAIYSIAIYSIAIYSKCLISSTVSSKTNKPIVTNIRINGNKRIAHDSFVYLKSHSFCNINVQNRTYTAFAIKMDNVLVTEQVKLPTQYFLVFPKFCTINTKIETHDNKKINFCRSAKRFNSFY